MENYTFARGAALFVVPMIVASCGGSSEQGLIKNSPDKALAGCTTVAADDCNQKVVSGVVAKVKFTDTTGKTEIRFVTLTDSNDDGDFSDGNFTYRDGNQTIVFTGFVGPDGETLVAFATPGVYNDNTLAIVSLNAFEDGIVGAQTDADSVPVDGNATYLGTSYIAYEDNSSPGIADEFGLSTLEVDFLAGLADLTIDLNPLDDSITEFDQIVSENMTIDGYSFTGDEVVLLSGVTDVTGTVLGANLESASAGMFFGPVNADGNPEEFGAVAIANGDDGFVYGLAEGQVQPVP